MAVVIVADPEPLRATVIAVGDALMVKLGFVLTGVTVKVTLVVSVVLPEVPFTMMLKVPVAVDEATVIVMVEVAAPVIEVGLKPIVTPVGWPVADNEIAELKPPVTVLVIFDVPVLPCATETEAGEAERLKPGPFTGIAWTGLTEADLCTHGRPQVYRQFSARVRGQPKGPLHAPSG
jgi:hypothetical protein